MPRKPRSVRYANQFDPTRHQSNVATPASQELAAYFRSSTTRTSQTVSTIYHPPHVSEQSENDLPLSTFTTPVQTVVVAERRTFVPVRPAVTSGQLFNLLWRPVTVKYYVVLLLLCFYCRPVVGIYDV